MQHAHTTTLVQTVVVDVSLASMTSKQHTQQSQVHGFCSNRLALRLSSWVRRAATAGLSSGLTPASDRAARETSGKSGVGLCCKGIPYNTLVLTITSYSSLVFDMPEVG